MGLGFLAANPVLSGSEEEAELRMHRNRGAAHYENQDYDPAVATFKTCVELSPESAADRVNLGLSYYRTTDYEQAVQALETARGLDASYQHIPYTLGLIYKKSNLLEKSILEFQKVLAADPADASTYYSMGVVLDKLDREDAAEEAFRGAVRHNPDHPSAHYYLFRYAKAAGRSDEARREMKIFSQLQRSIPDRERTEASFEEGPYLRVIVPLSQSFAPFNNSRRDDISFVDITKEAGLPELTPVHSFGQSVFADFNGDGYLDIYVVRGGDKSAGAENRLWLNSGNGRFSEATAASGANDAGSGAGVAVGDYDSDGAFDLYVLNHGPNVLLRNIGDGSFSDVTDSAALADSIAAGGAVFVDYDHDGDLDLLTAGTSVQLQRIHDSLQNRSLTRAPTNAIYRNNGNGTFTLMPEQLQLGDKANRSTAIAYGDCDDDDDTDLLIVNADTSSVVFLNKRGGAFEPVVLRQAGDNVFGLLGENSGGLLDVDNDGDLDAMLIGDVTCLFTNGGRANFSPGHIPAIDSFTAHQQVSSIEHLDFDNDGLLDILVGRKDGRVALFANDGLGEFSLVSDDLLGAGGKAAPIVSLDAGDIDGDGDQDILGAWTGGAPFLLENRGGESANWLKVEPVGERVPRQGIGSKLEIKTGPYYQRRDVTEWPVHFGLGEIDRVEVLRITWTNGIVQNMLDVPINQTYRVAEIVRADASCPFLYSFDGEKFNYVNDILGVAAMGVPFDEDVYHVPDPDEYVKIKGELLAEFDGRYQLRLAEEFKEATYLDQVRLLVIDHPSEVDVYPNERFSEPPFSEAGIHTVRNKRHPVAAHDHNGHDILSLVSREDYRYPSDIPMTKYDGLAERHWIEFDLGDIASSSRIMLYLTGWIMWSSASVNVAVSQDDQAAFEAVSLAVADAGGEWMTVIDDIGLPNGKNSTIPVDLTGKFLSDRHVVHLTTNMVVYWDEVFFTVNDEPAEVRQYDSPLASAHLHYRGFSAMTRDSLGLEAFDYATVERYGPWRQHAGRYTRYGDVMELLSEIDDRYVVYGPGEEISLAFDASSLPRRPDGWSRDYFFYAFGWIKDGDPNTVHSETVEPLPFIGMPGYPYDTSAHGRQDEIADDLRNYLTRGSVETVGRLNK